MSKIATCDPIQFEALAMPFYDCLWFHNDQIRFPVRPYLRKPRPKYPILVLEFGSFDCSLLDSQLLAKSQILPDQITSVDKQGMK